MSIRTFPSGIPSSAVAAAPSSERNIAEPTATATSPKLGWQARLKAKAKDLALETLSQDVNLISGKGRVGSGLANVHFHGSISEMIALKGNDPLVTSNPDRAAAKDVTWTKVGAVGDAGVSLLGIGYDRGVKVNAVVATDSKVSGKSLMKLVGDQAKLLTLEFHPEIIRKYPAGTEFNISGHKSPSFGAVAGPDISVLGLHAGAEIGAEVVWDQSTYAKNLTVEPNHKLSVTLAKGTRLGASVGAGVGIGYGAIDQDRRTNVGDYRNEANHADILSLHIGAGASTRKGIAMKGRFDLDTKAGQKAAAYVMAADPHTLGNDAKAAKRALEELGMHVSYAEKTTGHHTDLSASVFNQNIVNVGSSARTTEATLFELRSIDGQVIDETKLGEKEYTRTRTGLLPSWAKGEERESLVRMGTVAVNGGPETKALLLSLKVTDPKVSAKDSQEVANFAAALGHKANEPTGSGGKGELSVQLALTPASVAKLDAMSRTEFAAAFGRGLEAIGGNPLPWNDETMAKPSTAYWNEQFKPLLTVKQRWEEAQQDLANGGGGSGEAASGVSRDNIKRQYESSTGRDYYKDMNTWASVDVLSKQFEKGKGKPLADRGDFLKALSKLSSRDMQAAIVALRTSANAGIVGLQYTGNGVTVNATPELNAPQSVTDRLKEAFKR